MIHMLQYERALHHVSEQLQGNSLWPTPTSVVFRGKGKAHAIIKMWQARALNCRDVDKDIGPAIVSRNKAKSLFLVEELYGAIQALLLFRTSHVKALSRAPPRHQALPATPGRASLAPS